MSELSDLYPAMAAVAAITTAIQTPIALDAFNKCSKRVADLGTTPGEKTYEQANSERLSVALSSGFPNFPATVVNAFVIIPWGYLVYSHPVPVDEWLYFLPWLGVAVAALFLFLIVASSIFALWTQGWLWPVVAAFILGILAIWLMVAGAVHAWPF